MEFVNGERPNLPTVTMYVGIHFSVPEGFENTPKPEGSKGVPSFALVIPGILAVPWPEGMTWGEAMKAALAGAKKSAGA